MSSFTKRIAKKKNNPINHSKECEVYNIAKEIYKAKELDVTFTDNWCNDFFNNV